MHRALTVLVAVGAIACVACGTATSASRPRSGVSGVVRAGPTCPVIRPESPCPDRPVGDATVTAKSASHPTRRTTTASDGTFRLRLSPGSYTVTAESRSVFACDTANVRVVRNRYADTTITCDTGIR